MSDGNCFTVTYIEVAPASAPSAALLLKQWSETIRQAGSPIRMEVFQRMASANQFAIVSIWKDEASFQAVRDAAHTRDSLARLAPALITAVDTRIHNALIGGADTARGQGTVFIVTHIDVPPPNKDACIALVEAQVAAGRKNPGCVRFEVFQQADRPNHFSVVQAWADRAAYDAHIVMPHTRDFRMKLTPLSGGLYDERIYEAAKQPTSAP
jgi:quinol monooxygenase YgiN